MEACFCKVIRQYFVCKSDPIYNSPLKQLKAVKRGEFAYLNLQTNYRLTRRITYHSHVVQNTRVVQQYHRGHWKGTTPKPKKSINCTSVINEKTKQLIQFVFQLDFGR